MCSCSQYMNARAKKGHQYIPTTVEHIANILTHGIWILPSLVGLYKLTHNSPTARHLVVAWIYGISLCLLFFVSTAFHVISYHGKTGMILKEHSIGVDIVWLTWLAAALGVIYQFSFHERFKWLETIFYLLMGICPSLFVLGVDDHSGLVETAIGGAIYIIGVIFFKCDGILPFAHAIWHCFVTVAAACHYFAVFNHLYLNALPSTNDTIRLLPVAKDPADL